MDFSSNTRFNWVFITALLAAFASLSRAQQEIATEICSCAPNAYEFKLDFALTCPPVNITLGDAVAATTCMVSPFGEPEVADLVPVLVSSIDVLELNQNLQVMVQENIAPKEVFLDGDTFSYVSYAAIPGEIVNPEDLPRAIQLNLVGENANGQEIINVYLITFTNSCGAYPVLYEGQWAGWTRFRDLGPPNPDVCPPARVPSLAPTMAPTMAPTLGMSMSMSMDMGLKEFSIEDLLDGDIEYIEYSKGKGGKKDKSKSGAKAGKSENYKNSNKLGKPYSKDGKAKDGKAKDGKAKDGAKAGKSEKSGKSKDGKSESQKTSNKLGKPNSKDGKAKDGSKAGKSEKAKDGAKNGKPNSKDGKAKDGSKAGKSEKSKDGTKAGKAKDGKSDSHKTANKLVKSNSKDGSKAGKAKDGAKAGITHETFGKAKAGKSEKAKDGAKAGKSSKYEGTGRKDNTDSRKEANRLQKSDKSEGKAGGKAGGRKRLRI